MAQQSESMRTRDRMRSKDTMEFVKVCLTASGETFVMRADLPVGRGFNEKGQPIEYINMGWETAEVYDAKKNSEQAAVKREQAIKEKK